MMYVEQRCLLASTEPREASTGRSHPGRGLVEVGHGREVCVGAGVAQATYGCTYAQWQRRGCATDTHSTEIGAGGLGKPQWKYCIGVTPKFHGISVIFWQFWDPSDKVTPDRTTSVQCIHQHSTCLAVSA